MNAMPELTELLSRPAPTRERAPSAPAGPSASTTTVTAILAGVAAAGAGLLVIAVVVITTWASTLGGGAGAADALRAVAEVWLLAHRVSLTVTSGGVAGHVALLPIGLLALPAYALWRAGRWYAHATGVSEPRYVATGGVILGAAYGFVTAVVASGSLSATVRPAAGQALVAGFLIGTIFGTAGVAHAVGLIDALWSRLSEQTRVMVRAAAGGLAVLLATGAVASVGAVVLHLGRVVAVGRSLGPGPVGAFALVLACAAYLPNAFVWSTAYIFGPGFAVGAGTSVSPLGAHLGAVPAFPLLGALPGSGSAPLLAYPFLVMPLVAGAAIGLLLTRGQPARRWQEAALGAFATGAAAGAVVGLLAALSGGPAGPGRMATVGPSAWQVGLLAAVELGAAAALAAGLAQRRQ